MDRVETEVRLKTVDYALQRRIGQHLLAEHRKAVKVRMTRVVRIRVSKGNKDCIGDWFVTAGVWTSSKRGDRVYLSLYFSRERSR